MYTRIVILIVLCPLYKTFHVSWLLVTLE